VLHKDYRKYFQVKEINVPVTMFSDTDLVLKFPRLEFNVQLRLSGMSSDECCRFSNVSATLRMPTVILVLFRAPIRFAMLVCLSACNNLKTTKILYWGGGKLYYNLSAHYNNHKLHTLISLVKRRTHNR
jgi:hypothetical protein